MKMRKVTTIPSSIASASSKAPNAVDILDNVVLHQCPSYEFRVLLGVPLSPCCASSAVRACSSPSPTTSPTHMKPQQTKSNTFPRAFEMPLQKVLNKLLEWFKVVSRRFFKSILKWAAIQTMSFAEGKVKVKNWLRKIIFI